MALVLLSQPFQGESQPFDLLRINEPETATFDPESISSPFAIQRLIAFG